MSKLRTLGYLWRNNKRGIIVALFDNIVHTGVLNALQDRKYISLMYRIHVGKQLNLEKPVGFNEKLQWLKLYDHNPRYIELVDKYKVKNIVADLIGEEYIIPTIGIWDSVEDIDFEELPEQFVIKCTHDSGSVFVCTDKKNFDINKAKNKLSKALRRNLFYWGREWPYKSVEPKIIAEKYLSNSSGYELIDYKFMCFNGEVKCLFTVTNRFSQKEMHVTFYDLDWNIMPFKRHYNTDNIPIEKPKSFDTMVELSLKLCKDIPFARIDWYDVDGKPFFGEITLYPGNGVEEFEPDKWDDILGSWITLPAR